MGVVILTREYFELKWIFKKRNTAYLLVPQHSYTRSTGRASIPVKKEITDQLIDNVLSQLKSVTLPEDFFVSINIPPAYLEKKDVAEKLLKKIESTGLSYDVISLEVTERTPFKDLKAASASIELLKSKGMSVVLSTL